MIGEERTGVQGLYLLAADDIFSMAQLPEFRDIKIFVSFYEIYCGKLFDLLNGRQLLHLREDAKQNVNIIGLSEYLASSPNEILDVIKKG